jgi:ribonuclease VapC
VIVDSSALVAVAIGEEGARELAEIMDGSTKVSMSAATWLEAAIVLDRRSEFVGRRFDDLVERLGIEIVPVTVPLARMARAAHRRYGRGSGSKARLNFGDCFSYALSVTTGEPLLFVGEDFTHTDVLSAL